MQFTEVADKGYERHDVLRDSMIRPGRIVQVTNYHVLGIRLHELYLYKYNNYTHYNTHNYCITFLSLNFLNSHSANGILEE